MGQILQSPEGRLSEFAGQTTLETEICASCGVLFAAPEHLLNKRREDGADFYCPNGHVLVYKSKLRELEQRLQRERERSGRLVSERDQLDARLKAQRAATTRVRNEKARLIARVANGVCPCCNRTFKQLARHMAAKHPDFVDEARA